MRKLLILSLLLAFSLTFYGQRLPGVVSASGQVTAVASTLPNNLISAWKFEEASTPFVDSKAVANLAVGGTTSFQAVGKDGYAVGIDANGEYMANSANKCDEEFSSSSAIGISFWMYITSLPSVHGHKEQILNAVMNDGYLNVWLESDRLYFNSPNTVPAAQSVYSTVITTINDWIQVVVNITAGGDMKVYFNGVDETGAPRTFTGTISTGNAAGAFYVSSSSANEHFMGRLDEMYIYPRILTAQEIIDLQTKFYPFL